MPPLCWGCGGIARRGEPLCAGCRGLMRRLAPEPVLLCGVRVWAPVAYSGPARDLVRALKFRGATRVADAMAAQIAANAPAGLLGRRTLVPVPLHPRRLRARGYNQAALIAAALARRAGLRGGGLPRALRVRCHAGRPPSRRAARRSGRERRARGAARAGPGRPRRRRGHHRRHARRLRPCAARRRVRGGRRGRVRQDDRSLEWKSDRAYHRVPQGPGGQMRIQMKGRGGATADDELLSRVEKKLGKVARAGLAAGRAHDRAEGGAQPRGRRVQVAEGDAAAEGRDAPRDASARTTWGTR